MRGFGCAIAMIFHAIMKKFILSLFAVAALAANAATPLYKQANAPIEDRVSDLLGRMTIDEKIAQLRCPLGWEMYTKTDKGVVASEKYKQQMDQAPIGSYWAVLRADPWTQKTLETGLNPELSAKALNELQRYAVEHTRLGIPVLFAEECPHGHMAIGTTVFPTSLTQASTWNEDLIYRMGEAIGLEARVQGAGIGYGPVLDIAREPRWSRVEETFGEDPVLTATLGCAMMRGMQGAKQNDGRHVYSTLKHFIAYGIPEGGHNGARTIMGQRQLFTDFLPPFKRAVKEGVGTIMTSYNATDGVPSTANKYLLTDVLRGEWGFDGFVYSDLYSIEAMTKQRVATDPKMAATKAIKAGLDMDLGGDAFATLKQSLADGTVTEADIDRAVRNVLRLKFRLGLFENPYVSPEQAKKLVRSAEHKALAREVARQGTVLLKNDGVLPLSKNIKSVAVIGPNADMMYNQLGDYTAPQDRKEISTVLDGVKAAVGAGTKVTYVKGCAVRDTTTSNIAEAVAAAKASDAVILVVGGSSARDFKTKYIATGAATVSNDAKVLPDMDCVEGYDRSTLELLGDQMRLMREVIATGKPVVVVYIQGRTLNMNYAAEHANALLTAWYPGEQGGAAIADVIFGDYNPAGRLPVSVAKSVGELPVYYNVDFKNSYIEGSGAPLYAFGYGLSYSKFDYKNLTITPTNTLAMKDGDVLAKVEFDVTNVGDRDGDEVPQLYVTDELASVSVDPILLKKFCRVSLKKGETKRISFNLCYEDLGVYGLDMKYVVEPGTFLIQVGAASNDIRLKETFEL